MAVIVTNCAKRKRFAPSLGLYAHDLPRGRLEAVALEWMRRVNAAVPLVEVSRLYCGRQFSEALATQLRLQAKLLVVSAGLGVVRAEDKVAPYSLTIVPGDQDNVLAMINGEVGPIEWWQALIGHSPHQMGLAAALSRSIGACDIILLALPSSYLMMIECELRELPRDALARTRIFTAPSFRLGVDRLNQLLMPYDERLDGPDSPLPGTATDFSARAMRDFSLSVLPEQPGASAEEHAAAVSRRLADWQRPERPKRTRQSDDALKAIMRANWHVAGTSASQMLRLFRDQLELACEQGRMRQLHAAVRAEMEQVS